MTQGLTGSVGNLGDIYSVISVVACREQTCALRAPTVFSARIKGIRTENAYMDPSSFASTPFFGGKVRLLTYIRPLITASIDRRRAMMGYSRANSLSVFRASCTSRFSGFVGAGSTCLPSSGLLSNRG